jgi:hypothetical protein
MTPPPAAAQRSSMPFSHYQKKHRHRHNQRSSSWDLTSQSPDPNSAISPPLKGREKRHFSLSPRPRTDIKDSKFSSPSRRKRADRTVTFEDESVWSDISRLGEIPREKLALLKAPTVESQRAVPGSWRSSFSESEFEGEKHWDGIRQELEKKKDTEKRKRRSLSLSELGSVLRLRPSSRKDSLDESTVQRDFVYQLPVDTEPEKKYWVERRKIHRQRKSSAYQLVSNDPREDQRGRSREKSSPRKTAVQQPSPRIRERRGRNTDLRPSDSVSCQLLNPPSPPSNSRQVDVVVLQSPHPSRPLHAPGYRRAQMRTVSSDDYLLARGANPRTGVISPSVWTPTGSSRGTPSPGPAYPDLSPTGKSRDKGNPFNKVRHRSKERGQEKKWRLRGEEWISLDVDEPTPGPSPTPEEKGERQRRTQQHAHTQTPQRNSRNERTERRYRDEIQPTSPNSSRRNKTVPLRELQDRFVVNMPSAREPSPPQMSREMIEEYQKGFQRLASEGGVMVDPGALPKAMSEKKAPERLQHKVVPAGIAHQGLLTPITEQSGGTVMKVAGQVKRKPVGSPVSVKSGTPPHSPVVAGRRDKSLDTVVRGRDYDGLDQGRASSAPIPRKGRDERRLPTWNSPEDVGRVERAEKERIRSQSQKPFLGRGVVVDGGSQARNIQEATVPHTSSMPIQAQTQGSLLYETTMNAIRFLSPLYATTISRQTVRDEIGRVEKENNGAGAGLEEAREQAYSQFPGQRHDLERGMASRCQSCNREDTSRGEESIMPLPYPGYPPKNQSSSGKRREPDQRQMETTNAPIIITTTTTHTSIPTTTTSPMQTTPSQGESRQKHEQVEENGAVAQRHRSKPHRGDGAAAVPQVEQPKEKKTLNPEQAAGITIGRSWFLPPRVDLLGGWDVVGSGKAIKMGVERSPEGAGGARVPKALIPDKPREMAKSRCKCQGHPAFTTSVPREVREDQKGVKGSGRGFIGTDGLEAGGGGGGGGGVNDEVRCCDRGCEVCGEKDLRVRAIENGVRMRKVRAVQKEGEIAELESPLGSFDDVPSGTECSENVDSEECNDSDEIMLPRPLTVKRRAGLEDGSDEPESSDEEPEGSSTLGTSLPSGQDSGPSELDLQLSSLLDLVHQTGTLLQNYDAFNRTRNVLRRLTVMALHIFQTAVKLHDLFLIPRYYHPQGKKKKPGKEEKEEEILEIAKLTRDCAVAGGELLVLVGVAILVGRVGLTIVGCVRWMRWVGGWLGWLLKGLLW